MHEIQKMMNALTRDSGVVVPLSAGSGEFILVRLLSEPIKATSRFCVKGMHMNVRAGEWAFKGRRLLCVDEEEQKYTETAVEEVVLVQTVVDVDGGVAVKMEDTEHSGDSCVALVAGELERILRSSLYEHAQKNS